MNSHAKGGLDGLKHTIEAEDSQEKDRVHLPESIFRI